MLLNRLSQRLSQQAQQQRYRHRLLLSAPQAALTRLDQQEVYNFSSNDYLGLANHPRIIDALAQGAQRWGVGAGAASLVSGHTRVHHELEARLAALTQRPRALLFGSGYMANLAVLSSLLDKSDTVLHDRLNHASLIDGGLLAGCTFMRYQHVAMNHLEQRLQRAKGHKLIVSDGVFSMDGDIAPIKPLVQLSQQYQATVMIDDAHGFGVLGKNGAGTLEHHNVSVQEVPILMGTLGKALGTSGAFVAGSDTLIEYLIQFARPYIYSTAGSPALAYASLTALDVMEHEAWRRKHLHELINYFKEQARYYELTLLPSSTPIQPLILKDNAQTLNIATALRQQGFLVGAIRPPTVPAHSARLRITLNANHRPEQINALLHTLSRLMRHDSLSY